MASSSSGMKWTGGGVIFLLPFFFFLELFVVVDVALLDAVQWQRRLAFAQHDFAQHLDCAQLVAGWAFWLHLDGVLELPRCLQDPVGRRQGWDGDGVVLEPHAVGDALPFCGGEGALEGAPVLQARADVPRLLGVVLP